MGKQWKQRLTLFFFWLKITVDGDCSLEIKRRLLLGRKTMTREHIKKAKTLLCQQRFVWSKLWFSSNHVWMSELDYKESWMPKNWCFWTVVLEKTLESPLDCKEIQPVHPKGDQSWIFIGRTDAEAETPIFWLSAEKNWLLGKDPDAGKEWRQKEKRTTEDEMVGWHHHLDGREFRWTLGVCDEQGGLVCCSPRGHKESDWANELKKIKSYSVHSSTVYNSQDMKATWTSINRWMDKEDVVHIYNELLLSHKKKKKI